MTSWVFLFSRFTHEALLFEALVIFLLCMGYSAFWIIRKRRMGAIDKVIPAGLVKTYLNDLISQANAVRSQLFGLLADAGITPSMIPQQIVSADPQLQVKLKELEEKLLGQNKSLESLSQEKLRLEKELADAKKTAATGSPGPSPSSSGNNDELIKKIKSLEEKLAEYSVIEDDLANLKKLQQENLQLKATLSSKGITISIPDVATSQATAPTPAPEPTKPAEPQQAAPSPTAPAPDSTKPVETPTPEATTPQPPAPEPTVVAPTANPAFEGLVDKIEEKIETPASTAPPAAAATAPDEKKQEPSTQQQAPATIKSDDELLSEFEKMLES